MVNYSALQNNEEVNQGIILINENWRRSIGECDEIDNIELIELKKKKFKIGYDGDNRNKFKNNIIVSIYKELIGIIIGVMVLIGSKINFSKMIRLWRSVIKYSINNINKNKLNFSIGFIACFLVVFLIGTGLSVISNISVIYLSKADELANGIDLILRPHIDENENSIFGKTEYSIRLNYTLIKSLLDEQDDEEFSNILAKFPDQIPAFGYPVNYCNKLNVNDINSRYNYKNNQSICLPSNCIDYLCGGGHAYMGIKLMDFENEIKLFGKNQTFGFNPQPKGTVLISSHLLNRLEIKIGSEIYVKIPAVKLASTLFYNANITLDEIGESPYIVTKLKINGVINADVYKGVDETPLVIDVTSFYDEVIQQVNPEWNEESRNYLRYNSSIMEYVEKIYMKFPSPRLMMYQGTDLDATLERVGIYCSKILYSIGFSQISIEIPVMDELYKSKDLSANLGMLLNIVVFVFILLSVLLIYSTLMVDVETMTYNNGVFRMLGANFKFIIKLMISKTLIFTIPSIVLGLLVSELFLLFASKELKKLSNQDISNTLSGNAIGYSILFGFLIPTISLILPTRQALKKTLNESMDSSRSKLVGSKITLIKNGEDSEFVFNISVIGFAISIFGFVVCFYLPYGLVSGNFSLLMLLLFGLVIIVLIGALFLMINFHLIISKILIFIITILDPSKSILKRILYKNLLSHKDRNKSTIFMFGVSVSLIMMISGLYHIQVQSSIYSEKHYYGGYIKIESSYPFTRNQLFKLGNCLDEFVNSDRIKEYSMKSIDFSELSTPDIQRSIASNIGRVYNYKSSLFGITPNFFDDIIDGFLKVGDYPSKNEINDQDVRLNKNANGRDLSTLLYSKESMNKALLGSAYKDLLGTDYNQPFLLQNTIIIKNGTTSLLEWSSRYKLLPLAFLDVVGTFDLSKLPSGTRQDVITSLPSYAAMSGGNIQSVRDIPIGEILILPNLPDNYVDNDYESVKELAHEINSRCRDILKENEGYILNIGNINEYESSERLNSYFFDFATVLSMIISSFSLVSSMVTNISNQSKEIGILRSLGLSKFKINRIYIYEAFSLSFGSCILGILVGSFISYTILLEQIVITQKLLSFSIQWSIVLVLLISSFFISLLSVLSPINNLLKNSIIGILKK